MLVRVDIFVDKCNISCCSVLVHFFQRDGMLLLFICPCAIGDSMLYFYFHLQLTTIFRIGTRDARLLLTV